jgi:hypothetical protein
MSRPRLQIRAQLIAHEADRIAVQIAPAGESALDTVEPIL